MKRCFSSFELTLLFISIFFILASFFIFDRENYLTLIASVIGAVSLIFNVTEARLKSDESRKRRSPLSRYLP